MTLWFALHRIVNRSAGQQRNRPSTQDLAAYIAGTLPLEERERIRDYLAIYPSALEAVLKPCGPGSDKVESPERLAVWSALQRRLRDVPSADTATDSLMERTRAFIRSQAELLRLAGTPLLPDLVREFVTALFRWLCEMSAAADLRPSEASLLSKTVLHACFPVLVLCRQGFYDAAAKHLLSEWRSVGTHLGLHLPPPEAGSEGQELTPSRRGVSLRKISEDRLLWVFQTSVLQVLQSSDAQERGWETLNEIRTTLGLNLTEIGRILRVSATTVRSWGQRKRPIPEEKLAKLSEAQDAMKRLTKIFLPERLPQVIRRPAQLFDGETALDWILQGRIREVADRYDLLLQYQA